MKPTTTDEMSQQHLLDIVEAAEKAICAIQSAEQLINSTYGFGCSNHHAHPESRTIRESSMTLITHLAWLQARAASLAMLPNADPEIKRRLSGLVG